MWLPTPSPQIPQREYCQSKYYVKLNFNHKCTIAQKSTLIAHENHSKIYMNSKTFNLIWGPTFSMSLWKARLSINLNCASSGCIMGCHVGHTCVQSYIKTSMLNKTQAKWIYWQFILTEITHFSILRFAPYTALPNNE